MSRQRCYPMGWPVRVIAALLATVSMLASPSPVRAHEGHAALPSTGAVVDGDDVLVSERAHRGLGLETAVVTLEDLNRKLTIRADVESPWDGQAMVTTLVPGRVQSILVEPGETIAAGQELARIESLELETLQLAMLQAAEEVALAERLVDQRRPLVAAGAIPGRALLEDETLLRQRRVQLSVARRKLMALGLSEDALRGIGEQGKPLAAISVTSPTGGVVMRSNVRVGQHVDTEQHLFEIVDRSRVLVVGELLETDVWQIDSGQTTAIHFPALPEQSFAGEVERLRLSVRPGRRTVEVIVPVANRDRWLRPGMSGRMELTVRGAKEAIACPTEALFDVSGRTFVLVRQGKGKYQRREVETGIWTPRQVEILAGLFPGDRVIVTGAKVLAAMFHTDRSRRSGNAAESMASPATREIDLAAAERPPAIPVAHAFVELPTGRKTLATPVIMGRIKSIHVHPGETVAAGQLLAELDSQELRNLQLELLETRERLRQVSETIERVADLTRSGGYSQSQLWQHEMEQKSLQHQLQNVRRRLAMIGLDAEAAERLESDVSPADGAEAAFPTVPVRAPADGQVADFDVALGQVVHANDAIFELQNRETIWIQGQIFEQHARRIEVGQAAVARFPAFPDLELSGRVVRVAPTLDPSTRVLPVWVEAKNPGRKLREGMFAQLEIIPATDNSQVALRPERHE